MKEGRWWPWWINRSADIDLNSQVKGDLPPTHPAISAPPARSQSAYLRSTASPRSAGLLDSLVLAPRRTRHLWLSSSSGKQHIVMYSSIQSLKTVVPFCNSRCRHTHLSLSFGFRWLSLISVCLLRNNTLFLWKHFNTFNTSFVTGGWFVDAYRVGDTNAKIRCTNNDNDEKMKILLQKWDVHTDNNKYNDKGIIAQK